MKKAIISYISSLNLIMTIMVVMIHAYNVDEYGIPYKRGGTVLH